MIPSTEDVLDLLRRSVQSVLGDEAPAITLDAELGPDGIGIDSLDLIEIVMEVEEYLGVQFENEELEGVASIEALIKRIQDKVAETAPKG